MARLGLVYPKVRERKVSTYLSSTYLRFETGKKDFWLFENRTADSIRSLDGEKISSCREMSWSYPVVPHVLRHYLGVSYF